MTAEANQSDGRREILSYINASDSGDYAADCARGRELADRLIKRMADTRHTPMLGAICRGIIDAGRSKTVHIGFFQRLADRCLPNPPEPEDNVQHVEFWSMNRVVEVAGISRSEIYRRIKDGTFPRPQAFKCNARRFWMSHEIKVWQQSQLDHEVPELKYGIPQDDFEVLLDPC